MNHRLFTSLTASALCGCSHPVVEEVVQNKWAHDVADCAARYTTFSDGKMTVHTPAGQSTEIIVESVSEIAGVSNGFAIILKDPKKDPRENRAMIAFKLEHNTITPKGIGMLGKGAALLTSRSQDFIDNMTYHKCS